MLEGFFFFFGPDVGGGGSASGWVLKITRLKNEIKQIYSVISSKFRKDLQDYNGTQKKRWVRYVFNITNMSQWANLSRQGLSTSRPLTVTGSVMDIHEQICSLGLAFP